MNEKNYPQLGDTLDTYRLHFGANHGNNNLARYYHEGLNIVCAVNENQQVYNISAETDSIEQAKEQSERFLPVDATLIEQFNFVGETIYQYHSDTLRELDLEKSYESGYALIYVNGYEGDCYVSFTVASGKEV
ncbi:hypothetical protein G7L40_00360 [Paenibacillus polymyxa]|uniref:Uncharacterized protein n=1 Tax=Paenibacillus polymyxa TaxID=1406 RepID=A0A378XX07_PAEPO|nr:hypothetical protein [Paenibacillus polymyxa]MBE7897162.1 hypothetical protein [Paenibacillus polymyxa]MBG9763019.1 hypothetical protein [Paenibacillus polymyxa]MCC3257589.1 hypothetical protein [Paenibacillus polymyxa]QPK51328.1 hypothetical protein G7035_00360 [Paenibacillus polymyxa]QPK56418.1 hypothetical protein G7L40_00360 [Paenibacillus polymyxa]